MAMRGGLAECDMVARLLELLDDLPAVQDPVRILVTAPRDSPQEPREGASIEAVALRCPEKQPGLPPAHGGDGVE